MKQEVVDKLIKTAKDKTTIDDCGGNFNPYDTFGGNMDDAYWGGISDGETLMARYVLDELGIKWEEDE
jgi:hypothetical protein